MNIKKLVILSFFMIIFWCATSQNSSKNIVFIDKDYSFKYDLTNPTKRIKLNHVLREISGLTYIDNKTIATVQDEKGTIYLLDRKNGKIKSKIKFGKDGDYEGTEIIGKDIWVLKSDGTLYQVKNFLTKKNPKVEKYHTFLTDKNNTEGLGYDPKTNCLLIACKGAAFVDKDDAKTKAVYSFDIKSKKLKTLPFMLINLAELEKYKNYGTMAKWGINLLSFLNSSEGDLTFKPSGIAIHPITENIYILASSGKLLTVYSPSGKLQTIIDLDPILFNQPEGICFSPNGTLYISNEGEKGNATILKFKYNIQR